MTVTLQRFKRSCFYRKLNLAFSTLFMQRENHGVQFSSQLNLIAHINLWENAQFALKKEGLLKGSGMDKIIEFSKLPR